MQRSALFTVLVFSFLVFGVWACPDGPRVIGPDGSVLPVEAVKEAPAGTAISVVPAKAIALSGVVPMVLAGLFALATSLLLRLKRVHWLKAAPLMSVLLLMMVTLGLEASPVGLEVGAPLPQEATSGDVLHYVFKIMNTSDVEDTLMLGAASQHGWMTAIPEGSTVRLGPGETAEITVELAVPRAVTAGTEDILTLIVISRVSGEAATSSTVTKVTRNYMRRPHHVYGVTPVDTAGVYASAAYPAYAANDRAILASSGDYGDAMLGSVLACLLTPRWLLPPRKMRISKR